MVDYNRFAETFSKSRKKMKWEEILFFFEYLGNMKGKTILDIGCGSGRLLGELIDAGLPDLENMYSGLDLSKGLLSEAKKTYPGYKFIEKNMLHIHTPVTHDNNIPVPHNKNIVPVTNNPNKNNFDIIFFIASFHHLGSMQERQEVLKNAADILRKGGKICMTNWALNSELNREKYKKSERKNSENTFGSTDFDIKIGEYSRYYHCFSEKELEYLADTSGLKVIKNHEFSNKRNRVTILEK